MSYFSQKYGSTDDEENSEEDDSDDQLVDINDLLDSPKSKSVKSKTKTKSDSKSKSKRKRKHDTPSSASSASSDSDTASDSESGSDSDSSSASHSDSESSVSSVDSEELDNQKQRVKPSQHQQNLSTTSTHHLLGLITTSGGSSGALDLSDTAIVYRATRRIKLDLGQTQAPCGKCPQFTICESDGPVNPDGCEYFDGWLGNTKGGWDADALAKMRPVQLEEVEDAGDGDKGEGMELDEEGLMRMDDEDDFMDDKS